MINSTVYPQYLWTLLESFAYTFAFQNLRLAPGTAQIHSLQFSYSNPCSGLLLDVFDHSPGNFHLFSPNEYEFETVFASKRRFVRKSFDVYLLYAQSILASACVWYRSRGLIAMRQLDNTLYRLYGGLKYCHLDQLNSSNRVREIRKVVEFQWWKIEYWKCRTFWL